MKFNSIATKALLFIVLSLFVFLRSNAPGQEQIFPAYGVGKIEVRLYTDYFCPPCRNMEPAVEPILKDLIKNNVIRLTLVDVPLSRQSILYTRYFLYALKSKNDPEHAIKIRKILFETAEAGSVTTQEQIEKHLRSKEIPFHPFDLKSAFDRFNVLIREDHINATPTCVIIKSGKKEVFSGGEDIVNALRRLR